MRPDGCCGGGRVDVAVAMDVDMLRTGYEGSWLAVSCVPHNTLTCVHDILPYARGSMWAHMAQALVQQAVLRSCDQGDQ